MGDPVAQTEIPATIAAAGGDESTGRAADLHSEIAKSLPSNIHDSSPDRSTQILNDSQHDKATPPLTKPKSPKLPKLNIASKADVDPFSDGDSLSKRPRSRLEFQADLEEHHAEPPPLPPSQNTKQLPEWTVRELSRASDSSVRTPLVFHSSLAEAKDPLGEVLDWLGSSDIGLSQLPPDALNNSLDDRALSFDFVALEDDLTVARAQIPREWPPKQSQPHLQMLSKCGVAPGTCVEDSKRAPSQRLNALVAEDEEEWLQRQQRTGSVGRLVIYAANENPQEDVVLRGGSGGPLIVTSVSECGPASRAGIKAGDRLASINGKKHFSGLSADAVRAQLFHPPLMLVFLGFVGKLQAEVRLTSGGGICGMPLRRDVLKGSKAAPIEVHDHTIFNAAAPLLLAVREETESMVENLGALVELQRLEAASIVQNALVHAMHDGPVPLPSTPPASRENSIDRANTVASVFSAPVTRVASHGQDEPRKPGGDEGAVGDSIVEPEQSEDFVLEGKMQELEQTIMENEDCEEMEQEKQTKTKEVESSEKRQEQRNDVEVDEDEDLLRADHNIPRIPGMMFPATDRVIGAGLTPRRFFDRPSTTRTLAQNLSGPRASKPLVPLVIDPDASRLERFCA